MCVRVIESNYMGRRRGEDDRTETDRVARTLQIAVLIDMACMRALILVDNNR